MSEITIPVANAESLRGTIIRQHQKGPLLIVCHGYKASSRHPALTAIVKGLNRRGYTTFTFNFSDDSGADLKQQSDDIQSVVSYFEGHSPIVVLAASLGSLSASMAASCTPQIKGLVTVNGFFGSGKLGPKYRTTYKLFRLVSIFSPRHRKIWRAYTTGFKPESISVPVLVVHSKDDQDVSPKQSEEFYNRLSGVKELKLISKADHHLTSEIDREKVTQLIAEWLKKYFP